MNLAAVFPRAQMLRLQKLMADRFHRKLVSRPIPTPIVSFTFDDFPRSALTVGGKMLSNYGLHGTYYTSTALMTKTTAVGEMFHRDDLDSLLSAGHELACHTMDHTVCRGLALSELKINCEKNRDRIAEMLGGYNLRNFSFPEGVVTLSAKTLLTSVYDTCRTIEPGINRDPVDLGFLRANRVYSHLNIANVKQVITENKRKNGWVILYTHDISPTPSRYGCTPQDFEEVLDWAMESGSEILPIAEAAGRFTEPA